MYPFEIFTGQAKHILMLAQEEAESSGRSDIGSEHLLLGILRIPESVGSTVLTNLGAEITAVRKAIESIFTEGYRTTIQQVVPTVRAKKAIEIAFEQARRAGSNNVGSEQLLIGILMQDDCVASQALLGLGITLDMVKAEIERVLPETTNEGSTSRRATRYGMRDSADMALFIVDSIMSDPDSVGARALNEFGITSERLLEVIDRLRADDSTIDSRPDN